MKKKIIYISFISFFLVTIIFYEEIYNKLPWKMKTVILSILNNDKTSKKILNDRKTKFLPETQLLNLEYSKLILDQINIIEFEVAHGMYGTKYKSFYLEHIGELIFLITRTGELFSFNLQDKKIKNLKKFETNFDKKRERVLNFHLTQKNIYLAVAKMKNENCEVMELRASKYNNEIKAKFDKIIQFDECLNPDQAGAGALSSFTQNGKEKILFSTPDYEKLNLNQSANITQAQNEKSPFGKILLVDPEEKSYKIYSSGHRVILGIYSDINGDTIIATENGPFGGDEINLIKYKNNYGWNISSYGEMYGAYVYSPLNPTADKSHSKNNFSEPLFSWVPSIAPSSLIKLDNNFSPFWQDNYLMGSLVYSHLIRLKFDDNMSRLILQEPMYVGERIRDLIYLKESKTILLALETSGSIGIINNNIDQ